MLIENQTINIKWGGRNKQYYSDKGYTFTKLGDEFTINVIDLPRNSDKLIKIKCDNCGKIISVKNKRYFDAIEKYGDYFCCHCTQKRTIDIRSAKHFSAIDNFCKSNKYILKTNKNEINSLDSKITYLCPSHGEQTTTVTSILQGKRCYRCSRETVAKKAKQRNLYERQTYWYQKALDACKNNNYTLVSKYTAIRGITSYIEYICPSHGTQKMGIGNIINGKKCPKCNYDKKRELYKLSHDEVEKRIAEFRGTLLNKSGYINQSTKNLRIKCPECGTEFVTSLHAFIQHGGQVCLSCYKKESNGERAIRYYLESNHIDFEQEKWFSDCRDSYPLRFDFYLPTFNCVIEFDGAQHFDDTHYFNYSIENLKKHDKIKNEYCSQHNIQIIRIPYWEFKNINTILDNQLLYSHEDIV